MKPLVCNVAPNRSPLSVERPAPIMDAKMISEMISVNKKSELPEQKTFLFKEMSN